MLHGHGGRRGGGRPSDNLARHPDTSVAAAVAEDDDLDLDPALAACIQLGLSGPHLDDAPAP